MNTPKRVRAAATTATVHPAAPAGVDPDGGTVVLEPSEHDPPTPPLGALHAAPPRTEPGPDRRPVKTASLLRQSVPAVVCSVAFAVLAVQSARGDHTGSRTPPPSTKPMSAVVLTRSQAQATLTRYVEVSNAAKAAAASGDLTTARSLTGRVETGPQQAQSLARYVTLRVATPEERRDTLKPVSYPHARVLIPARVAGQPWFEAISSRGASVTTSTSTALVFVKGRDGAWRMSASVRLDGPPPGFVTDASGRATAVDPNTTGLAMSPYLLYRAVNDDYVSGGRRAGDTMVETAAVDDQRSAQGRLNQALRPDAVAAAYPADDPYHAQSVWALATTDGGAAVITSRAYSWNVVSITPGAYVTMPPRLTARPWVHGRSTDVTVDYTCVTAAEIPKSGWTLQIGDHCEAVHAQG